MGRSPTLLSVMPFLEPPVRALSATPATTKLQFVDPNASSCNLTVSPETDRARSGEEG